MFNVNSSRKNGDESSKEAAKVAAAAVPVGICAAVSHAAGLEASPTSGPPAAPQTQMGSAAPRPGAARDDLDGDSEFERFEAARGFYVLSYESRKRPGKTLTGFQKALARIPVRQLWALAQGVRDQIQRNYAGRLLIDGFVPLGCDGSRVECPRTGELEARLGKGSNETSAPTAWVTAFVHLGLGLLWSWRIGTGDADERLHLRQMLRLLPPQALVVADAAYMGYELACAILRHDQSFLLRLSSKNRLYAAEDIPLDQWQEGLVFYWPETPPSPRRFAIKMLRPRWIGVAECMSL